MLDRLDTLATAFIASGKWPAKDAQSLGVWAYQQAEIATRQRCEAIGHKLVYRHCPGSDDYQICAVCGAEP